VLETMQKEFVHYAEAAGYERRRIVWVYVLRNSVVARRRRSDSCSAA